MFVDSTAAIDVARLLDIMRSRPAEIRTAGELTPQPIRPLAIPRTVGSADSREAAKVVPSSWLADAIQIIESSRADAPPGTLLLLDDAEQVAALVVSANPGRRPQLNVLPDGRPSFATSTKDLYFHLTIDRPGRLTWYATANDQEYFGEDVPFDGRRLPQEVRQLLSA